MRGLKFEWQVYDTRRTRKMPIRRIRTNPNEELHKIVGFLIILGMCINLFGLLTFNPSLLSSGFMITTCATMLQVCCLDRQRHYLDIEVPDSPDSE